MNDILKNSPTFLEILGMARSEVIRDWEKETFQRAYNWAVYFEKVHAKLKKHLSLMKQLDAHLKSIIKTKQLRFGQESLDFNALSQSTNFLLKCCLANPWLSLQQLPFLVELYSKGEDSSHPTYRKLLHHGFELSRSKVSLTVLSEMKDKLQYSMEIVSKEGIDYPKALCSIKCKTSDDVAMEISAQSLLSHIQKLLEEAPGSTSDKRNQLLAEKLALLSNQDRGFELLLRCVTCSELEHNPHEAKEFVLEWLIGCTLHEDTKLWKSPPVFLSQTAFLSVEFFKHYLGYLLAQTYNHDNLDNIMKQWKHLFNGPEHVKQICTKALKSAIPSSQQYLNQKILDFCWI